MKTSLSIEAETEDKLLLLIRVAEEMGITVEVKTEIDPTVLISEKSLAREWNSTEDSRWDKVYAHLKNPS